MARLPRFSPLGMPQHVIQRGNNRQACFADEADFKAYLNWLNEAAEKYEVEVHAFVQMTNHVHLLLTPNQENGISKLMQLIGRRYVRYFNYQYQRTGTLWEGRYKSCVVDSERYLLECYRYIELNPVRAQMVKDPADYAWSSYRHNALGTEYDLIKPHDEYLKLGKTASGRQEAYRALFATHVESKLIAEIGMAVNKGMALGSERFKDAIERQYARRVRPKKAGRPRREQ